MRLKHLWIEKFKSLVDFEITFDHESPYSVLVGRNGSGKSNLFEAMVLIFDCLERGVNPPFGYQLSYTCHNRLVKIDSDPKRERSKTEYWVSKEGSEETLESVTSKQFHLDKTNCKTRLLPEFVFGYYSGCCERFKHPFDVYQQEYNERLRKLDTSESLARRFLYGDLSYAELIIVALWAHSQKKQGRSPVLKYLGIRGLSNVSLKLKPPKRFDPDQHDPNSMGLCGLMREFTAEIDFIVLSKPSSETSVIHGTSKEMRKHYLLSKYGLKKLAAFAEKRDTNLFSLLLSAQQEGILESVSFTLKLNCGTHILVDDLSEGEKQFLLVMGMLRFSEHEQALFLLDEPDTHLNPRWSAQYLETVEKELGHQPKSQIVLATHDPLMLMDLDGSQVQVLDRDTKTGKVSATPFKFNPKEMGVDGLLTSKLFGLQATIGTELQALLAERATLISKGKARSTKDNERLKSLTSELSQKGFSRVDDDPIYASFLAAMARRADWSRPALTPEQKAEQERIADEILAEVSPEGDG